jgi:4-amino-4-deoxy-L-arabinose transferase-like glycosyltransferase
MSPLYLIGKNVRAMSTKQYIATLFCLVFVEAIIILIVLGNGHKAVMGGDGQFYHETAINLLKHGVYSLNTPSLSENPSPTLLRPPGYSSFLAGAYAVFGESFFILRVLQFFLIGAASLGIYLLAKCYCDETSARVSGILCVTYPPITFFAIYHLSETLATVLLIYAVYLAKIFIDKSTYLHALLAGALLGCMVLVRANFLLLVFFFAAGFMLTAFFSHKHLSTTCLKRISVFVISFFLVITPWLLRNKALTGKWIFSSSTFQSLNVSVLQYNGKISYDLTDEEWKSCLADQRSRMEKAKTNVATRPEQELELEKSYRDSLSREVGKINVYQLPKNLLLRIAHFWWPIDVSPPEIKSAFYHRVTQAHFLLISLLIFVGAWWRRQRLFSDWLLWCPALCLTFAHLIFHVEPRYSLPARPLLLIYSSVAITAIFLKSKNAALHARMEKCA